MWLQSKGKKNMIQTYFFSWKQNHNGKNHKGKLME